MNSQNAIGCMLGAFVCECVNETQTFWQHIQYFYSTFLPKMTFPLMFTVHAACGKGYKEELQAMIVIIID